MTSKTVIRKQRNPQQLDDEALLGKVAARDRDAFEALYDRYERRAFSLAYRIPGSRALAEAATQEAFLSIWKNAAGYDPSRGSAGGWSTLPISGDSIAATTTDGSNAVLLQDGDSGTLQITNLDPPENGTATAGVPDLKRVDTVYVSLEPDGGSPSPITTPVIAVDL